MMGAKSPSLAPNRRPDGTIDPAYGKPEASPSPPEIPPAAEGMTPENARRLVRVPVSYREFVGLLTMAAPDVYLRIEHRGIPAGSIVVGATSDDECGRFVLRVWHHTFAEVPPDSIPPVMWGLSVTAYRFGPPDDPADGKEGAPE